jgi:predicted SprT family Zn-dependent metalloprotease
VTAHKARELYDLLRKNPPFSAWRLPTSEKVHFEVRPLDDCFGDYSPDPHTLRLSTKQCEDLMDALTTVAHEMVHMRLYQIKDPLWSEHGASFEAVAKQVCKIWGFDPQKF